MPDDLTHVIDVDTLIERLEPNLSPGAKILRQRHGIGAYRADKSGIVGEMPLFVLQPRGVYDVQAVCRLATALAVENEGVAPVAIVARGGGTGLCGGAVPTGPSIVLDMSTMDRFHRMDTDYRDYHIEPGVSIARLNNMTAGHALFFPAMPTGAAESATVGGVISTNARGMYAMKYGSAGDCVHALDVVMADGSLARFGHDMKDSSSGMNLVPLFIGAEGTLGVIVGATVRLRFRPVSTVSAFMTFDTLRGAMYACGELKDTYREIAAMELVSRDTISLISSILPDAGLPRDRHLVMLEAHLDGEPGQDFLDQGWLSVHDDEGFLVGEPWTPPEGCDPWDVRHRFSGVISEMSEGGRPVRLDPAVPLSRMADYLQLLESRAGESGKHTATCIFGHVGAGTVHILLPVGDGELWRRDDAEEFRTWAIARAIKMRGTASGEHGLGMTTIDEAAGENAASLQWMTKIKTTLDPYGIMNPGKVIRNQTCP